jgi:hypothetical protein
MCTPAACMGRVSSPRRLSTRREKRHRHHLLWVARSARAGRFLGDLDANHRWPSSSTTCPSTLIPLWILPARPRSALPEHNFHILCYTKYGRSRLMASGTHVGHLGGSLEEMRRLSRPRRPQVSTVRCPTTSRSCSSTAASRGTRLPSRLPGFRLPTNQPSQSYWWGPKTAYLRALAGAHPARSCASDRTTPRSQSEMVPMALELGGRLRPASNQSWMTTLPRPEASPTTVKAAPSIMVS